MSLPISSTFSIVLIVTSAAGAETTAGVLSWWLLAMVVYPETQKRAQAELDDVVGRERPPNFADLESLPYIRAMVSGRVRVSRLLLTVM